MHSSNGEFNTAAWPGVRLVDTALYGRDVSYNTGVRIKPASKLDPVDQWTDQWSSKAGLEQFNMLTPIYIHICVCFVSRARERVILCTH